MRTSGTGSSASGRTFGWCRARTVTGYGPIETERTIGYPVPMNPILLILILLLLFGGGGFYLGGPAIGGGALGLILLICVVVYLMGGWRSRN
jgi:hypothetical protein